jgi:hypothetical protein
MFLNVILLDTTIAHLQNLRCLIDLSFTREPPGRFRDEGEDDSDEADHRPLKIRVSLARQTKFKS